MIGDKRMEPTLERAEKVTVRRLRPDDFARVVALDTKLVGRDRTKFFETVLKRNLQETDIQVSLAAEFEGIFAGYLLARVWYGEFGTMEPYAVLESLGVHPDFNRQGIGKALLEQLVSNLNSLGLTHLRTEVEWGNPELMVFFQRAGFMPASRLCLDFDWPAHDPRTRLSER
jgi:ribosomal protein S18 acetylase RimI-like enzyme